MFGLGQWEIVVVGVVALLIFGSRLPAVARSVGSSIRNFRKGLKEADVSDDIKQITGQG